MSPISSILKSMLDEFNQQNTNRHKEVEEQGVEVPFELLGAETLDQLIKAFVMREGTDYGVVEVSLEKKVEQIRKQLENGYLKIVFDLTTDTGSILPV